MTAQLASAKQWFINNELAAFIIKVIFGSSLIALLAQVSVPMIPVPITGQTLGITTVGFALGLRAGVASVLFYLIEGCLGLPVFANGASGVDKLFGATGGYLYGFVFAAGILGYYSDRGVLRNFWKSVVVAVAAAAVIFFFGLIQLSFFVPEGTVFKYGLYPFIPGGIIKALLAAVIVTPTYRFFSKL